MTTSAPPRPSAGPDAASLTVRLHPIHDRQFLQETIDSMQPDAPRIPWSELRKELGV